MPCCWEGNRRSGVTLAMRHRLQWFFHLRAHGLDRQMSTLPTVFCGVCGIWPICFYLLQLQQQVVCIPLVIRSSDIVNSSVDAVSRVWH